MSIFPERSHPLKWEYLAQTVEESGMVNPDVWIEDLRRVGACRSSINGAEESPTIVCESENTDGLEASFSTICDMKNNRIIIRHHF